MSLTRGDIYWVSFDPTRGSEMQKSRPAILVSIDPINSASAVVIVVPVTEARKTSPVHILIPKGEGGLKKDSIAHCGQLRSVDKVRIGKKIGQLDSTRMAEVSQGLRDAMGL